MTQEKLPQVQRHMPYMGCDPEFFFQIDNEIVGSEHFLDKDGFKPDFSNITGNNGAATVKHGTTSTIVIDGVQAELNPRPNTCRANLANEIGACFRALKEQLEKSGKKVEVNFDQTIEVSKKELSKLDESNQKFGCAPSFTSYRKKASEIKLEKVDPLTYRTRSAGGHIHIGVERFPNLAKVVKDEPKKFVKMLDIICGNTCVLVDRDKGNIERRKLYGRAGEYRLPEHGLEYRTLSNFWLQQYHLMSLSFGLARVASALMNDEKNKDAYYKAFTKAVKMKDIQKAINTNDFDLAYKNFKAIQPLLEQVMQDGSHHPFGKSTMNEFLYFVEKINENGLSHWFKHEDPFEHWTSLPEAHKDGIHFFLVTTVRTEMNK